MDFSDQNSLNKPRIKTFSQIGLACFMILAVTTILQLAARFLTHRLAPQAEAQSWYLWAVTVVPMYLVGVPCGIALFRRIPTDKAFPRKLRFKDLLIFLIMCFPILFLGSLLGWLFNSALHALLGTEVKNPLTPFVNGPNVWLTVFFMVLLGPVIEEFVFRRLIIDRVRPYGEGTSVLVSALMFGLFHGNLLQFFYAFGLGAIFAFIYLKTGRLRYTIFLHMAINLTGVIPSLLTRGLNFPQTSKNGSEAALQFMTAHLPQLIAIGFFGLAYLSLAIAGFVLLIVKRRAFVFEPGPLQPRKGTGFRTVFLNVGMVLFIAGVLALFVLSVL